MKTYTNLAAAFAAGAALFIAAPAIAGSCPTDQFGDNPLADAPMMPSAVTDNVVGSVDLQQELSLANRDLRLRRLVVQPGGIVPLHSHAGRPALITVVSGQITEYSSTCRVGIDHEAGDVAVESGGISHWWRNNGSIPAVLLSADVKARD